MLLKLFTFLARTHARTVVVIGPSGKIMSVIISSIMWFSQITLLEFEKQFPHAALAPHFFIGLTGDSKYDIFRLMEIVVPTTSSYENFMVLFYLSTGFSLMAFTGIYANL